MTSSTWYDPERSYHVGCLPSARGNGGGGGLGLQTVFDSGSSLLCSERGVHAGFMVSGGNTWQGVRGGISMGMGMGPVVIPAPTLEARAYPRVILRRCVKTTRFLNRFLSLVSIK